MPDAAPPHPAPAPLVVWIVAPPEQQAALAAALPAPAFAVVTASAGPPPPAVVLFAPADPAGLAALGPLGADGLPVVALVEAAAGRAEAALAAGASDYVYRLGDWAGRLPFHLARAAAHAAALRAGNERDAAHQRALRRLAHDLRGPLTYLVGYSELLALRDQPPAQVRQMAEEMLRQAEALAARLDALAPPPARPAE